MLNVFPNSGLMNQVDFILRKCAVFCGGRNDKQEFCGFVRQLGHDKAINILPIDESRYINLEIMALRLMKPGSLLDIFNTTWME